MFVSEAKFKIRTQIQVFDLKMGKNISTLRMGTSCGVTGGTFDKVFKVQSVDSNLILPIKSFFN